MKKLGKHWKSLPGKNLLALLIMIQLRLELQRDLLDFPKSMEKDRSIQKFFGITNGTISQLP